MKDQKKVLKHFPNAKVLVQDDGTYVVESDDVVLAEEFFLPDAFDAETAWKHAALACKTKQHFDRTHPDRMELSDRESKFTRITTRRRNAKKNKRSV
jgi:hypothetical protein